MSEDCPVDIRCDDPDEATLEDIWVAGQPVGKIIESLRTRVDELEADDEDAGIDMDARAAMIDIHVALQDLKHGRDVSKKSTQRAARLLQPFIREMGDSAEMTGIEHSYGRLKLTGDHAARKLEEHNLGVDDGMSVTVGRAMEAAVRGSEWGDDEKPLFTHSSEQQHTLSVDIDAWRSYLQTVAAALDAEIAVPSTGSADDPETGEDAADVAAELDQLDAANAESANTVVSTKSEAVLGGDSDD